MSGHDENTTQKNTALRVLLDEAEMSNAGLGRSVVVTGAREGIHLATNTTSVRRMLEGCQPRWPAPRLVAVVLSRRLRREVTVTDCGFIDRTPPDEDPYDGLTCSGTLEGTIRTVVELSGRDMRRRKLLLGSVFSTAAFAEPALFAVTAPPAERTAHAAGRRIGMAEVEILTEQIAQLRQLDYRYGAGRVREQAVSLLHREANQLLHTSYTDKTGKALLSTIAQATSLAGFTAEDVGRHSLAQRYSIQALDLAMRAGDRLYAANVLGNMSRMTLRIGENTLTDHDRLRHGRQALARSGLAVAQGMATPGLAAVLHTLEGQSLALLGDAPAARRAAREAERHYESMRPGDEPPWSGFYTEASFAVDLSRCLRDTGERDQATRLLTQALETCEPWQIRPRCIWQADLSAVHLLGRDPEQAAALGRDALRTAAEVSSHRTLDRLRTLQRQVRPLRSASPHLAELDERITDFLTRTARRHQQDNNV